ncbi:hypothetical protein PYJP_17090 [Pyrofollis japonicus]|uniref:hypothetical protein n=1 Tax=Pyrofollis japonicus TaxID=3060460 RepID=UPI00295A786C|nr:hypothetical protein [Pyrofollis japonicus]BEP18357.1 hypothetical protein PYJP_17090 [Pyrofollis japonicus]
MTLLTRLSILAMQKYAKAREAAWRLTVELLAPGPYPVPRVAVQRLLRRALRNGAWRTLASEQRALLVAAARAPVTVYQSAFLVEILRNIWVMVEMATVRGRAVYAAILHLLVSETKRLFTQLLEKGLDVLLAIGIQLLDNPWLRTWP